MLLILCLPAAFIAWVFWRISNRFLLKSPIDNVPGPLRTSILKGNFGDLFNRHGWDFHDSIGGTWGSVSKVHGMLGGKALYVFDPQALNSILVKDHTVFEEPQWFTLWNEMTFGPNLLSTSGSQHRRQRKLLNPAFATSHMRELTPIFYGVVHRLRNAVSRQVGQSRTELNVMEWMTRTALEVIGQGGLGYSFDPLSEATPNVFGDALKAFAPINFSLQPLRILSPHFLPYIPKSLRKTLGWLLPFSNMRELRDIVNVMDKQARRIYGSKRTAMKGRNALEKDIINILTRENMEVSDDDKLHEEEIIAQICMLVFAGTDTTSNALARTLQLLSHHHTVQDRLRAELLQASPRGEDIPYDELVNLPYLDAVCRETLRLHSPVTVIVREANQDTVLPLAGPIQGIDGDIMHEILIPQHTTILLGIRACNQSKAIWGEDALEWRPERWLQPLPESVTRAHIPGVYSNLMTFSGGGRACIGFKFSQLEMKVVLAVMLRSFRFFPSDKAGEIYWNLAAISYPTVGVETTKSSLPLVLEPIPV